MGFFSDKSNDQELVFCNTNLECPSGLDYCHPNDFIRGQSSGKVGVCAPRSCDEYEDCPDIGDVCLSGAVSGSCANNRKCDYNFPMSIAVCTQSMLKRF